MEGGIGLEDWRRADGRDRDGKRGDGSPGIVFDSKIGLAR